MLINKKHIKAFTLIELLVVISVLGILIALSTFGAQKAFENSRDTRRKSDLKEYQSALENYANGYNGLFPKRINAAGVSAATTLCTDLGMTSCPDDPVTVSAYKYQSDGTGATGPGTAISTIYVLWVPLENVSTPTWWVFCSNGKVGTAISGIPPSSGNCPI